MPDRRDRRLSRRTGGHRQVVPLPRPREAGSDPREERNHGMTDPASADRLLELLAREKQPELSPYFEARLRRRIAEPPPKPEYTRFVRYGALAFMLFSAALLASYDYLRWLIP